MTKRLMLMFLVLCISSLAYGVENFTQKVTAAIQPVIQVTWPEETLDFGNLSIGVNETDIMQIKVISNIDYSLLLQTEKAFLTEFNLETGMYGEMMLSTPLFISVNGGVTWQEISANLKLVDSEATSDLGKVYSIKYKQEMAFPADKALVTGSIYKTDLVMIVTAKI